MQNENKTQYISIREASVLTGINPQTLRKLGDEGKIKCYKTLTGQRKFDKNYLEKMCNSGSDNDQVIENTKQNFIYARVSSKKQMDDLTRQIEFIKKSRPEYASYLLITDIASGVNFNRKGLCEILDAALRKSIKELVVAHRDRLSRFGFDLIKLIIEKQGGKITVLDDQQNKSSEQELSEDLLSIIHIFSCMQMGRRSYKIKQDTKNNQNTTDTESTTS
jgi:predicted site-specific integrase-resolvase